MKSDDLLCPSAPLTQESFLFGILDEKAEVHYTEKPIRITEGLAKIFNELDNPEKHFRFSMKCSDSSCAQWENEKCSIASALKTSSINQATKLTACAIRRACRWFSQEGERACKLCKYIVTDIST
ncbi:MAG: hypothetical protein NTX38_13695 [Methylobacter sp.]|nr:hypothetical protein [Methylobacter sp.]